jgi:hypothetical protein
VTPNAKAKPPKRKNREPVEFDLDAKTMALVEKLAEEEQVTPFEMCVILLKEHVATVKKS